MTIFDNEWDALDTNPVESVGAVPTISSVYDDPRVKELLSKLAELEAKLASFSEIAAKQATEYNRVKSAKEDFLQTVNQQLQGYDNEMRLFDRARREAEAEMWKIKEFKQQTNALIDQMVEDAKAQERLAEIAKRWEALEAGWEFEWTESIRGFQKDCLRFVVDAFETDLAGVLVADQMGLGKTLEACASIDVIQQLPSWADTIARRCPSVALDKLESKTILWLCPTSIKEATVRELRKWGRNTSIKLEGSPEMRSNIVKIANEHGMVLVVGYEQLRDRKGKPVTPELFEHSWPLVVLDEAHRFKNESSSTFTRVEEICAKAGFVLPMTGTPIMNRPSELWAILHMLTLKGKYEGKFRDSWRFVNEYCSTWGNGQYFEHGAYDKLIASISDMVIRRRKDEVLEDMPDKVREVRYVEMGDEQRAIYDQMRDDFIVWLDEQKTDYVAAGAVIAQLTRLRQIALYPAGVVFKSKLTGDETMLECTESAKLDEAMDIVEELLANDEKVLIFANYNAPLDELAKRIRDKGWVYKDQTVETAVIKGGMTDINRANKVDRFNDPDNSLAVICGNIQAMGLGLNLQHACSNAIFLDLGWNPGINEQAEDRLHRQGQKNAVTIHIIQCEDSVDAFIAQKLEDKQNMIEGVMERDELRKAIMKGLI